MVYGGALAAGQGRVGGINGSGHLRGGSSASNTSAEFNEKRALYFEAGAREAWFCDLLGNMEFFDPAGPRERSAMCPEFPTEV